MITVTNSRMLMDISLPSLLSDLYRRVQCYTLNGKYMCHQKPSSMDYPPAHSRQLLPNNNAVGVCGMTWAIGVFHVIPKLGRWLPCKNLISCYIDLFMMNLNLAWLTSLDVSKGDAANLIVAWAGEGSCAEGLNNLVEFSGQFQQALFVLGQSVCDLCV